MTLTAGRDRQRSLRRPAEWEDLEAIAVIDTSPIQRHSWRGDASARRYHANSKARATRIGYAGDWRRFREWCRKESFNPMPASPATVARYATDRAQQGKTVAHIRRELAAIAFVHRDRGHESPTGNAGVKTVLQGIARSHPYAPKKAPAILPPDLLMMVETLDLNTNRGARDAAVLLLGWVGAFRRSELAASLVEHVTITERGLLVDVPKQKNHQSENRVKEAALAEEPRLCATLAMRRWLRMSGRKTGPLFVSVKNGDRLTAQRISGQTINRAVQCAAEEAGLSEMGFTAHSLRSGFITHSFQQGKSDVLIAQQTGHQSMNTLAGYHRRATALGDRSPTAGLI
jgi:integrase